MKAASETSKGEKKQIKNMLKVMRPRVYITDSASFKSLVQELTGNGRSSESPTPSPKHDSLAPVLPVMGERGSPGSCSSEEAECKGMEMGFDYLEAEFQNLSPLAAFTALQPSWAATQRRNALLQERVEAWPIEVEPFQSYDSCYFQNGFGVEEELFPSGWDVAELLDILQE